VNTEDRGYSYDSAWNLSYLTNNGTRTNFRVDSKDQLTAVASANYTYDSNGNLTQENAYWTTAYTYDDENRLVVITNGPTPGSGQLPLSSGGGGPPAATGGWKAEFTYDGLSRLRIRKDYYAYATGYYLTNTTWYIYDGRRVIQERDGNNNPLVSYTRGADLSGTLEGAGGIGGLLARSSGYSSGNWTSHAYYHADGSGNITYLVDSSQAMAATYRYDPFGNTMASSGALAGANLYRFSSKEVHANSGLYYFLYRFYDPVLQRWINRDPIAERGGINLYSFVANGPPSRLDPNGRFTLIEGALAVGVFTVLGLSLYEYVLLQDSIQEQNKAAQTQVESGNIQEAGTIGQNRTLQQISQVPDVARDLSHVGTSASGWPTALSAEDGVIWAIHQTIELAELAEGLVAEPTPPAPTQTGPSTDSFLYMGPYTLTPPNQYQSRDSYGPYIYFGPNITTPPNQYPCGRKTGYGPSTR
jgi:RHS repeat-associated protein